VSYYQPQMGDYYRRGDPGFLSSVWKGVKAVGKAVFGGPTIVPGAIGAGIAATAITGTMPGGKQIGPPLPGPMGAGVCGPRPIIPLGPGGCCPTGYHPAKNGEAKCVRNRRMNITNPQALRRSMRRVQGFEKLAKRTIQFTKRTRLKTRARS